MSLFTKRLSQIQNWKQCPAICQNSDPLKTIYFQAGPVQSEPSKNQSRVPEISGVELDSLVSQVRDLLPDLGEGFVELCLRYFDLVPEKVINALLEGKRNKVSIFVWK